MENIKIDIKKILLILIVLFALLIPILVCLYALIEATNIQSSDESSIIEVESTASQNESAPIETSDEISDKEVVVLEPISKQYTVIESDIISELKSELNYCQEKLSLAQSMIDSAIELGYEDTDNFIQIVYQDCENYQSYIDYYKERINELNNIKHTESVNEYPAATYIWDYMKAQGWSDYVCAGVMGNIMQETGGRTLNIDYMHDNAYYGMCCWKKEYHPKVVGLDLEGQCAYLIETVTNVMNSHGYLYQKGYTFEDFLEAESIEEAAAAFMIVYERPEHTNPIRRVENGEKAYEYFVG